LRQLAIAMPSLHAMSARLILPQEPFEWPTEVTESAQRDDEHR
jgi:hypothetical protein